ncbi:MAG: hypothetical protein IPM29_12385 [Planctomycetes bacterium]|nr:hypothetical protein [Planctomycetota bacterium]
MGDSFEKRQRTKQKQDKRRDKLLRKRDRAGGGDVDVVSLEDVVDTREVFRQGGHDPSEEMAEGIDAARGKSEEEGDATRGTPERAAARRLRGWRS